VTGGAYDDHMTPCRGFSLVELLTALVLLGVGLAAFTRAASAVAWLERDTRLRRTVAAVVTARLDSLAGQPCDSALHAGEAWFRGVHERWMAMPEGRHLRLADSVDVPVRPALARVVAANIPCRP